MKKFYNGEYIDLTPEEIAEYESQQPPAETTPTLEERLAAAEAKIAIGEEGAAELAQIKNELLNIIDIMEGAK